MWQVFPFSHTKKIVNVYSKKDRKFNIYIYIYISKDLMWESMKFYHVAHFTKRIEILLSYIKDKNKFKNRGSLILLVQCFKTSPLSHTQKTLCISIHCFHFYSFIYTYPQPFMPSYLKYTQKKKKKKTTTTTTTTMLITFNLSMTSR